MSEPRPPVNVRVQLDTGEVVPVSCVLNSIDANGTALWVVVDLPRNGTITALYVDTLPPHTSVQLTVLDEG